MSNNPSVPQPITAIGSPGSTCPTPKAWTATASGSSPTASSSPISGGSGWTNSAGTATRSANTPGLFSPSERLLGHTLPRRRRHTPQVPQGMFGSITTRVPTESTIRPTASWPRMSGYAAGRRPSNSATSLPHTPARSISTTTSPGPGVGAGTSWTITRPGDSRMAARMLIHVTISADAGPDALASVAGDRLLMYVPVHMLSRRFSGGLVLAAVALTVLGRGFSAAVSGPPPQATAVVRTADAPIILMGIGSQTTEVFYLSSA